MFRKKNYILIIILFLVTSCGDSWDSVKRGLTNQKQKSTDEFLVQKKDPLILPPDFDTLPSPDERNIALEESSEIEKLILGDNNSMKEETTSEGTSVENIILRKIKIK